MLSCTYRWQNSDEELAAVRIRTSIGHAHGVRSVVLQCGHKLVLKVSSPNRLATSSSARRVSSLHHKALDDSMENVTVVVARLAVDTKVLDRFRAFGSEKLHMNVAQRCVNRCRTVHALDAYTK